jgi:four helix bundle protein
VKKAEKPPPTKNQILADQEEAAFLQALDHENFEVYQLALDFVEFAAETLGKVSSSSSHVTDQLKRSSTSVALNIAEGSGKLSRADKHRYYKIATGSATESAAAFDVLFRLKEIDLGQLSKGETLVRRIVSMLIMLAKSVEAK